MLKMAENSAEERRKRARVCEARSEKARVNGRKQKKNQSAPRMKKDRKIKNGERQYPVAEKFGKSKAEKTGKICKR